MKIKSKFLLLTLVLLLVTLGTISASESASDTTHTSDVNIEKTVTDDNVVEDSVSQKNSDLIDQTKTIVKNKETSNVKNTKTASQITVTNATYDQFFNMTNTTSTTDLIRSGDVVNLKGTFNNVDFAVDKSITLTSLKNDAQLNNCTIYVKGKNATGSTISNLVITNTEAQTTGIQIKDASKLLIKNNIVSVNASQSFALSADRMNHSTIDSNFFEAAIPATQSYAHTTLVLGTSYYNTISNNTLHCCANGIYLSYYGNANAGFEGGLSHYNNITGNTVYGDDNGWCYTIQVMGSNNIISYNTVSGGYRGISTQDQRNNKIFNNDVSATVVGIYAAEGSTVNDNNVHVENDATAITIGGNDVKVSNNVISTANGTGIEIQASDVNIAKNNITTETGYGIHSKGQYSNIVMDGNRIRSGNEGILFRKQSNTKKINNVLANANNIISQADYAINFEEAGSRVASEINVTVTSSNVLKSALGSGNAAYLKPLNSNTDTEFDTDQVIELTSENYDEWFDEGQANIKVKQNATIYFKGTFSNDNFIFSKKVHIIGDNCVINQGTITLTGDAHESTITGVTIKNNKNVTLSHGIELIEVNNCKITNTVINVYAVSESLGIFLCGAEGNTISGCTITSSGDYINNAILAYSSDLNTIYNNVIYLKQSNVRVPYDDSVMFNERIGTIQEVLHNHGIILLYSSDNTINKNKITATSKFTSYTAPADDCKNSLVGIDIYFDSHNNQVTNNKINITTYTPFAYGMGVLGGYWGSSITSANATANVFKSNNVVVNGGYFATGFIAGRNSLNTTVSLNNITVAGKDFAFGVTLENSSSSLVSKNNLKINGSSVYTMELFDSSNNQILNNVVNSKGTLPMAIAGSGSSNNQIKGNTLTIRKVNLGQSNSAQHSDAIPAGDYGIYFMQTSSKNTITSNTINTNATTAVYLTSQTRNNVVKDNSIKSKSKSGDKAVLNEHSSNNVSNNFVYFVNVAVNPVDAMIGTTINFVANVTTTTNSTGNLKATFSLGSNVIGTSGVTNGKANVSYRVSSLWRPAVYQITVNVSGTNFQNATGSAKANLKDGLTDVVVKVPKVLQILGTKKSIVVNITDAKGGKVGSGKAQFYLDNKLIGTSNVTLGKVSIDYTVSKSAVAKKHNLTVVYLGSTKYAEAEASNAWYFQNQTVITVSNRNVTLGGILNVRATVKSGSNPIASGNVSVRINGNHKFYAKIVNGVVNANYTIPTTYVKGDYILRVVYAGTNLYSSASKAANLTMKAMTPVFHYNTTKAKVGSKVSVALAIDNGKTGSNYCAANGGKVYIRLNGALLRDANNNVIYGNVSKGKIVFTFTAPTQLVGYQNLTFVFKGNNRFNALTKTYTKGLYISKNQTVITVASRTATLGGILNVRATVKSGSNPIKSGTVSVRINGNHKFYAKIVNGVVNANYTVPTSYVKGKYNLSVVYAGGDISDSARSSANLTLNAMTPVFHYNVTKAKVGSKVSVVLAIDNGKAGSNYCAANAGKVYIRLNGALIRDSNNTIICQNVSKGKVKFTFTLPKGLVGYQNLTFVFKGNKRFNALTKTYTKALLISK